MLTGFAFVVGLLMMAPSPADSLPRGFRYPTEADRRGAWEAFKGEVPTPFHAKADFNGDGISDDAWILLHESNEGWGLFVFVNEPVGSPSVIELEREMGSTAAQQLATRKQARPG